MTFREHLLKFLSEKEIEALLASLDNEDQHAVLLNTKFMSDEEFLALYPHVTPHPYVKHAYIYDKNEYPLGKSIYHELGYFYLQEPSAMIVSSLIPFEEDDFVLDLCAAPGGKTVQASLKMNNKGLIISNDLSKPRAFLITNNLERLGISNVVVTNNDFKDIYELYLNKFDKIILDAPCSGSGMFRKEDKMIDDWSINKVYKFAEIQKELISYAYKMLKPGGLLSYSTCSYSMEEDEEVIEYLLDNSDAQISPLPEIKNGYVNKAKPYGVRFMPHLFNGEGQYVCHIKKPGTSEKTSFIHENKYQKNLPDFLKTYHIEKYGDTYFGLINGISFKKLNIIRPGMKILEEIKGIPHYDLHFARSISVNNFPYIDINLEETKIYLSGEVLRLASPIKGYALLTYNKKPIDLIKTDGSVIKNNYPKGLRKKF